MFTTHTFLARRKLSTKKSYTRALTRFASCVGFTLDNLHEYLAATPKEKLTEDLLAFADSLKGKPNTQRLNVAAVMSYLTYNDIAISKPARKQITPERGDPFPDRAFSIVEVKKVFEYLSPVGRASLLLLISTGMRIGEMVQIRESDMEGRIIHLKSTYTKNKKPRDVVMTQECFDYLTTIWLPQKQEYLKSAQNRNKGLVGQTTNPIKQSKAKPPTDDRIIPIGKSTAYTFLMAAFRHAGFDKKIGGMFVFHPHSLRKSFRSIVGSTNPDLAEVLLGHEGYLSSSYLRLDILKEYEKVEHLLTISGSGNGRVSALEAENAELKAQMKAMQEKVDRIDSYEKRMAEWEDKLSKIIPGYDKMTKVDLIGKRGKPIDEQIKEARRSQKK